MEIDLGKVREIEKLDKESYKISRENISNPEKNELLTKVLLSLDGIDVGECDCLRKLRKKIVRKVIKKLQLIEVEDVGI